MNTTYVVTTTFDIDGQEYEALGATAAASTYAAQQFTYAATEGDAAVVSLTIEANRYDTRATVTVTYDDGTEMIAEARPERTRYTDAQYFTPTQLAHYRATTQTTGTGQPGTECDPATCENRYHD